MAYFDFAYLTEVFMINVVENKLSKIHSELQTAAMKLRDYNLTAGTVGVCIHFYYQKLEPMIINSYAFQTTVD